MQDRESPLVANLERQLGRKLTPDESRWMPLAERLDDGSSNSQDETDPS